MKRLFMKILVFSTILFLYFPQYISTEDVDSTYFLQQYGYLPRGNNQLSSDSLPKALRMMQRMAGIKETGILDEQTIRMMKKPRCGIPDVQEEEEDDEDYQKHPKRVKRQNGYKYKWDQTIITYGCRNNGNQLSSSRISREQLRRAIIQAANEWSQLADIEMIEISNGEKAMIQISTERSTHYPCHYKFDHSTLAHAFFPPHGQIHVNDDVRFSMANYTTYEQGNSLYSVVAHEMGHALGFSHSPDPRSLMYAYDTNRRWIFTEQDKYLMRQYYGTKKTTGTTVIPKKEVEIETKENEKERKKEEKDDIKPDECKVMNPVIVLYRNEYFFFKSQWVWRVSLDWNRLIMKPVPIDQFFRGVPNPIDSALVIDQHLWLFVGDLIYVIYDHQLLHGPLRLSELGINYKSIDLAYEWNYFDPPSIYLWKNDLYWKLDEKMYYRRVDERYPKRIKLNWGNVPKGVSSAFTKDKEIHFIRNNYVYRMNSSRSVLDIGDGYPISLDSMFGFCPKTDKLVSKRGINNTDNFNLLIIFLWSFLLLLSR